MRTVLFIQARMSSTRLPGKMLMDLGGMPLVEFVYRRCLEARLIDSAVVITSEDATDDILATMCRERNVPVFRGPLDDVLARHVLAARHYRAEVVCRVCGDSPFIDITHLDALIALATSRSVDYAIASNCMRGFISEVISLEALEQAQALAQDSASREHVTLFARRNPNLFRTAKLPGAGVPADLSNLGLTIDVEQDLALARKIVASGLPIPGFTSEDVLHAARAALRARGESKAKEVYIHA